MIALSVCRKVCSDRDDEAGVEAADAYSAYDASLAGFGWAHGVMAALVERPPWRDEMFSQQWAVPCRSDQRCVTL